MVVGDQGQGDGGACWIGGTAIELETKEQRQENARPTRQRNQFLRNCPA